VLVVLHGDAKRRSIPGRAFEGERDDKKGDPIAFEQNDTLYPPLVGEMISIGEETGSSGSRTSLFMRMKSIRKRKTFVYSRTFAIFIGVVVGFFALKQIMLTLSGQRFLALMFRMTINRARTGRFTGAGFTLVETIVGCDF
jgi:hypothetical protein